MKRKASIILGTVATIGAIVGGSQLRDRPVEELRAAKDYRLALLGEACVASTAKCDHRYNIKGDLCMCMTDETEDLPNEVKDINILPQEIHYKFLVCKNRNPEPGEAVTRAAWYKINAPLPAGWTCETIHAKGVKEKSVHNAEGDLLKSLKQWCCSACAGECFVAPGEWGACPHCCLDDSCSDYCP